MSKFDSGRFDGTRGSRDDGFRHVNGFTTKIHEGRQGKHIVGHNNYQPGKSVLHGSMEHAQELIELHAGLGRSVGAQKERVDFGEVIGTYVSRDGKVREKTTVGIIHYSKQGAHLVPTRPAK